MSAADMVVRMVVATVLILVAGTTVVLGMTAVLEPMYAGFGEPASSLGWGTPGLDAMRFISFSMLGTLLVVVLWFVFSPIRDDVRQEEVR